MKLSDEQLRKYVDRQHWPNADQDKASMAAELLDLRRQKAELLARCQGLEDWKTKAVNALYVSTGYLECAEWQQGQGPSSDEMNAINELIGG